MKEGYATVVFATEVESNAGGFKPGQLVVVVNSSGQPTGEVRPVASGGQASSPIATSSEVQSAVAAALKKVTLTGTGSKAFTHTTHNGAEVHAESGITECTMALTDFQASGVQQTGSFWLFNYTGGDLPLVLGAGWSGGISMDGNTSNDLTGAGTLITIPHATSVHVVYDADGWVRADLLGIQVTQSELDTGLAGKEDSSNKVTTFSSPTNTQYPSALLVSNQLALKAASDHTHTRDFTGWTSYTPIVTSESGAWSNYTITGRYRIVDRMLTVTFALTFTGTPTAANGFYVSLPSGLTMNASMMTGGASWDTDLVGFGIMGDSGVVSGVPTIITTRTTMTVLTKYYNAAASTYLTCPGLANTSPWNWTTNDTIAGQFTVPIL